MKHKIKAWGPIKSHYIGLTIITEVSVCLIIIKWKSSWIKFLCGIYFPWANFNGKIVSNIHRPLSLNEYFWLLICFKNTIIVIVLGNTLSYLVTYKKHNGFYLFQAIYSYYKTYSTFCLGIILTINHSTLYNFIVVCLQNLTVLCTYLQSRRSVSGCLQSLPSPSRDAERNDSRMPLLPLDRSAAKVGGGGSVAWRA